MQFITKTGSGGTAYNISEVLSSKAWSNWNESNISDIICQEIYDAYIDHVVNPSISIKGAQFAEKSLSGAISLDKNWPYETIDDFLYLQIHLSEKLKNLNYIIQMSEVKAHENGNKSLIIYQKPSFKLPLIQGKSDQMYGNIHMELKMHGELLIFFKIIVHRYNDYRFESGRSFCELMEVLFKTR